jgi:hypothetical protein
MAGPEGGQRWRYVFGGRLGDEHLAWVFHDLTDRGWVWRILRRVSVQLLPFELVAAVLPGLNLFERALLLAILPLSALMTTAIASEQVRNRRLRQHDLPIPIDPDEEWRNRHRSF